MNLEFAVDNLPCDLTAERFVLGALMTSRTQIDAGVVMGLSDDDFSLEKHHILFRAIRDLIDQGDVADIVTVANRIGLDRIGIIGGLAYLTALTDGMPELHGMTSWINLLHEKARLRRIIRACHAISQRALSNEDSVALVSELRSMGEAVSAQAGTGHSLKTPGEIISSVGGINPFLSPAESVGLLTPFRFLNEEMLGFDRATLTTLAARPAVGKSAMATQIAHHIAKNGHRVAFYAYEMRSVALLRRLVGTVGTVNSTRLKRGVADFTERQNAMDAVAQLVELDDNLLISDKPKATMSEIIQSLRHFSAIGKPIEMLIVDYLQIMQPEGRFENRQTEVSALSRGMKLISQMFDIPVLQLSQLSRDVEKQTRKPRLSDLRESGSLEQDSDNVLFLHRLREDKHVDDVEMILAKSRNGPTGDTTLTFTKRYTKFDEMPEETIAA